MNKKKLSLLPIAAFAAMLCACSDSDSSSVSIEEWDPPISSSSEVKDEYSSEKEEAKSSSSKKEDASSSSVENIESSDGKSSSSEESGPVFEEQTFKETKLIGDLLSAEASSEITDSTLTFKTKVVSVKEAKPFCDFAMQRSEYYIGERQVNALAVLQNYTVTEFDFTPSDTIFVKNAVVEVVNRCDAYAPYGEVTATFKLDETYDVEWAKKFVANQGVRWENGVEINLEKLVERMKSETSASATKSVGEGLPKVTIEGNLTSKSLIFKQTMSKPETDEGKKLCSLVKSRLEIAKTNPVGLIETFKTYTTGVEFAENDTLFFTGATIEISGDCENVFSASISHEYDDSFDLAAAINYAMELKSKANSVDINKEALLERLQK